MYVNVHIFNHLMKYKDNEHDPSVSTYWLANNKLIINSALTFVRRGERPEMIHGFYNETAIAH